MAKTEGQDPDDAAGPVALPQVLWDELALLQRHDGKSPAPALEDIYRGLGSPHNPTPLSALCFSGGGIRSATFNLGIVQALAKLGLLRQFDYVSSVSGGGYIAGWLRTWCHFRGSVSDVEAMLANPTSSADFSPLAPEPAPIDHLREYSNYLTPRVGFFSADTWAFTATVVRNLILNWLVLIPALAAVVAIPQVSLMIATGMPEACGEHQASMTFYSRVSMALALAAALWSSTAIHYLRRQRKRPASELRILTLGVVPLWIACLFLAKAALFRCPQSYEDMALAWFALAWCVGVPLTGWFVARILAGRQPEAPSDRSELFGLVFSGLVAAVPLFAVARGWLTTLRGEPALFVVFAVPILLGVYLLARTLFVAFASLGESDRPVPPPGLPAGSSASADREWWARASGWVLLAAIAWMGASALVVLGAYFVGLLGMKAHAALAAAGGATGLFAALLGASPGTKGHEQTALPPVSPLKDIALKLLGPLTVVFIVLLLGELTIWVAGYVIGDTELLRVRSLDGRYPQETAGALVRTVVGFLLVPLAFMVVSWLLGWVVNVNRFSAHGVYRNRLARAYLGASHTGRHPDPFTGFDPRDNVQLHELANDGAPRPLLVVNTTLNLVKSAERLAWQQRKAESFSMTPLYCGNFHEGYRRSREYGGGDGISLATAVTISGAAASPNSGYHSSPLATFLMTLFNLRLGCWLGNTNACGSASYRDSGPSHAGRTLFSELLGFTDAGHPYVNLSDGGHFENLGIYEMVLRRCRFIVASDAGQDPNHDFEDLGNAIRKIRIDFGVPITFDQPIRILPRNDEGQHGLACALGRIHYDAVDAGAENGWLLYLKPTLLAEPTRPPYDVFSYSRATALFPHESTADQWFSEAQFESYRALGEDMAMQLRDGRMFTDLASLMTAVEGSLNPPAA